MKVSYKKLLLCLAIAVGISVIYKIYRILPQNNPKNRQYENAYLQVNVGDSKEKVTSLFGEPKTIENCPEYEEGKCAEVYRYVGFIEAWGIMFDKNEKVYFKYYKPSE